MKDERDLTIEAQRVIIRERDERIAVLERDLAARRAMVSALAAGIEDSEVDGVDLVGGAEGSI